MAWKTYFGFLIILLVKETASEDPCKESPHAVTACETVVDVKRQLFIPINNTIGDGCQCTVELVSITEDPFTDKVETKFLDINECGFNASTELDGVLETLTCDNSLVTKDMETGDEMIYRFTGRSDADVTVCLQIVPQSANSRVNISCADQITDPNTASSTLSLPTTSSTSQTPPSTSTASSTSKSTAPSTSKAPSKVPSTSQAPPPRTAGSLFHTSSSSPEQTTKSTPDDYGVNGPKSTTFKPNADKPDITFIIILIGSCVGGFLLILLIILITWCIIYRRRKKRYEAKKALPNNEADHHSLEGIQFENELFILANKDEGKEDSKQTDANDKPIIYQSPQKCDVSPGDQLPDIVKPSENGVKKVNFDVVCDPIAELPEESVTEFKTDTILMNDAMINTMTGRIQL
ncbi:hypothetical protein LOTGIDRAFT_154283 [Lottia gigantea]|uniref:ZP domain-containing protein n=1 Tax=Lottia gigantea TaxID=225164 RepID=V4BKS4_LOTGI|nr:hypothetical protein LOTGIDRAFT_154283 [Lottia gigantea]ESO89194.1 hypothetical protein LOTGIDRAFT_154283 [Lottia gigantea]